MNLEPLPSSLSTQIFPPWACTAMRQNASPIPKPEGRRSPWLLIRANFSKMRFCSAGGMPGPLSFTQNCTESSLLPGSDLDLGLGLRELDRILQQVDEHAAQHVGIHPDIR